MSVRMRHDFSHINGRGKAVLFYMMLVAPWGGEARRSIIPRECISIHIHLTGSWLAGPGPLLMGPECFESIIWAINAIQKKNVYLKMGFMWENLYYDTAKLFDGQFI